MDAFLGDALAFFGVDFFIGAAFLAAVLVGGALLVAWADPVLFVTRPDLVLPSTTGLLSTAGA